jgi:hypothetical protein
LTWEKKEKSKTHHTKSEQKGKFESLRASP